MMTTPATEDTSNARPTAFLARIFPRAVEARIEERYSVVRNPDGGVLTDRELAEAAQGCHYLFVSTTEHVSRLVFDRLAGTLKAVATLSVGFDHIDLQAARENGVAVFHSPGVLTDACAEIALLLVLNAARRGHEADALVRSGTWHGWAPTQMLGVGLSGKRGGILGMGRIGQAVAQRLRGFGMQIHYHNRTRLTPQAESGATYHATPESLLRVSDFFILCAARTPGLTAFLNADRIALLPANAVVVNISRGDLVDDEALIAALRSRRIFAAGLDVFANEPALDPRYATLPNVFLTPHIGSATEETRNAMGFILLDGLNAYEHGVRAENQLC